jgi:magnesium transporter
MLRIFRKTREKVALAPGTLVYTGKHKDIKVRIRTIRYSEDALEEKEVSTIEEAAGLVEKKTVTWIDITGIHDIEIVQKSGDLFNLHSLVLEDIVNTNQRPKIDNFEDYLYLVLKMIFRSNEGRISAEQVSVVCLPHVVISFQETEEDVFEPIRNRIKNPNKKFRRRGGDYLAYAIMDSIVDHYYVVLESFGEEMEKLEETLMGTPDINTLNSIHHIKRDLIFLRKFVWPLRELVSHLQRSDSNLIKKSTLPFLSDLYDHTIQVIDTIESLRDMASGMIDLYLSTVSNRMNEVMKVLTIIATIFIPLTFVAGIYGMNFENMPELKMKYAYFAVWGVMAFIGILMLVFFKRKKWL